MPSRVSAIAHDSGQSRWGRLLFIRDPHRAAGRRPARSPLGGSVESFPVSPNWFYSVTAADGSKHLALSAASGATIYAQVPVGTVVVPQTPLAVHQAAGAFLWRAREGGGVAGEALEALEVEVPTMAAPLVIAEVRKRGAFRSGWSERLHLHGLKVVSPEGLTRATERLPLLLGKSGVGFSGSAAPRKASLAQVF